jgi:inward rectifier potassium channel
MARNDAADDIVVLGARWHPLRDAYHFVLKVPWWGVLGVIMGGFFGVNLLYAIVYLAVGGIDGMRPGSLLDAFFFSVQTMGTIGYGVMHPVTTAANFVVVSEAAVGLVVTALCTGIVFARFSRTPEQLVFSRTATVSAVDGVPTLAFRVGNDRASTVFGARVQVSVFRTEKTAEGVTLYRLYDAKLVRDRTPTLARSWNVMHPIIEGSPLFGLSKEAALREDIEVLCTITGTDDVSLQPVNARHIYRARDLSWGVRLADVLTELPDGRLELDLTRFHETVPNENTVGFSGQSK